MVVGIDVEGIRGAGRLLPVIGAVIGRVLEDVAHLDRRERGIRLQDQRAQAGHGRRRHAGAVDVVIAAPIGGGIAERGDDVRSGAEH